MQLTRISSEILLVDIISLLLTKASSYVGIPSGISEAGRFDKTLTLETLPPKQTAEIKQRAGISRVHFGPRDPACSSRLSNTVTAYGP